MFIADDSALTRPSINTLRGPYLQIVECIGINTAITKQYRAVLRRVTVVPFGNFSAVSKLTIASRAYGPIYGDTVAIPYRHFVQATIIPDELYEHVRLIRFDDTGEHRKALIDWAWANFAALTKTIRD